MIAVVATFYSVIDYKLAIYGYRLAVNGYLKWTIGYTIAGIGYFVSVLIILFVQNINQQING